MKRCVQILAVLVVAFWAQSASAQYSYGWQCSFDDCSFTASTPSGVSSYEWKFGDGDYGYGSSVQHSYDGFDFPSCGEQQARVTLTFYLTNGMIVNRRCYVTWWETCVGGDPTQYFYSGTCSTFS